MGVYALTDHPLIFYLLHKSEKNTYLSDHTPSKEKTKQNRFKNPSWQEAEQLTMLKSSWQLEHV